MDQALRNQLQRATQNARQLLEAEFAEQLEGTYDILPDGTIPDEPGAHLNDRERLTRRKLVDAIQHRIAGGRTSAEAVADYTREAAFTFLNRFVALKMLEARELVQQCVSKGELSSGFKEFTGLAPALAERPDKGYRLYLECLFDELSIEVKVLFDRQDVASLLWPRRQALMDLLATLNQSELADIWDQDETIGWVYQYFNGSEERKKMREASQAPRNGHELAVRNQFFTPRYVVEFLGDNTLGRIWYEMRRGDTKLVEQCRYLVRRPTEIFMMEGEKIPELESNETLSQEELLKQPVHIPFRAKKDPRDLRVLDPACGSGHFLLYCFDLLLTIYREAWHDEESPPAREVPGPDGKSCAKTLREDYRTTEVLEQSVPSLILRHNLYGIEIDPRCAQIAAFALWMQAQRVYSDSGATRSERAPISKTNIAIAEPMPGEPDLLREFTVTLSPPLLGKLVQATFGEMRLAGEAGSLLQIEEEIRDSIAVARQQWDKAPEHLQMNLFGQQPTRQEKLDFSGITDDAFWHEAEERIYEALHRYTAAISNGQSFSRRLFAEDAERGFAFIDLCRKRYDVILMNPPFGDFPIGVRELAKKTLVRSKHDLAAAFVDRALMLLHPDGFLGAITTRTLFFLPTSDKWRHYVFSQAGFAAFVDLGLGVMDDAMVSAAAYVLRSSTRVGSSLFFRVTDDSDRARKMHQLFSYARDGIAHEACYSTNIADFEVLPGWVLPYWLPKRMIRPFKSCPRLGDVFPGAKQGIATSDDFRFVRAQWEIPANEIGDRWRWHTKGGENAPFFVPVRATPSFPGLEEGDNAAMGLKGVNRWRQTRSTSL